MRGRGSATQRGRRTGIIGFCGISGFMKEVYAMRSIVDLLRFAGCVFALCGVVVLTSTLPAHVLRSWAQPKSPEATPAGTSTAGSTVPSEPSAQSPTAETLWDWMRVHRWIVGGCLAAVILIWGGILLYRAAHGGPIPRIQQLGPSFFFWLAMMYTALLLLMGGIYNLSRLELKPTLLGGILPVAVPWFGALGAVTI